MCHANVNAKAEQKTTRTDIKFCAEYYYTTEYFLTVFLLTPLTPTCDVLTAGCTIYKSSCLFDIHHAYLI